jgi:hypothetical protein
MDRPWLGFIEMFVVLMFAAGWAVLELAGLRLDRKRREREESAGGSAGRPSEGTRAADQ